jgi:hypothetical protein
MSEQEDVSAIDADEWPLPSVEVVRELDPPAIVWSEREPAATPQTGRSARG